MTVRDLISQSIEVKQQLLDDSYISVINEIGETIVRALREGRQVLVAGNGGSAADAQHFAGELTGRFLIEREPLPVLALTTNTSFLTAIGNDLSYDQVFSRQVEAYGKPKDIFVGISTSGNSKNILDAFVVAKREGLICIGLLGKGGGQAKPICDLALVVPSANTQYIQEAHIAVIHALCYLVDMAWKEYPADKKNGHLLPDISVEHPQLSI